MSSIAREWPDHRKEDSPAALDELLEAVYTEFTDNGHIVSSGSHKFPSHLEILREAARDWLFTEPRSSEDERGVLKPSWKELIALLFHEYFYRMQRYGPLVASDPLVDALLLLCEKIASPEFDSPPFMWGFADMYSSIKRSIVDGLPSSETVPSITSFLEELVRQWKYHKHTRLEAITESLMPWSTISRQEGSLDGPIPAQDEGDKNPLPEEEAHSRPPIVPIPDMPWLGAKHDGYPRSSSITSYVVARWSPSFTPSDNAALWQAAMTFGFLEVITGLSIPSSQLLETRPDGDVVFTSKNLNLLAYNWSSSLQKDETPTMRLHHSFNTIARASKSFDQVVRFYNGDVLGGLWTRSEAEVANILCFIYILIHQFQLSLFVLHGAVLADRIAEYQNSSVDRIALHTIYEQKMVEDGWCPFLLGSIRNQELVLWEYMSTMKPFIRESPDEHCKCTRDGGCVVHNIDVKKYKTRHVEQGCSCPFIIPSIGHVKTLLSEGHYPVMSYDETTSSLTTHSEDEGPYVAISHVWVDGLGSNTESGLPACQIKRIHKYVCQLLPGGTPAFWIDGLCIPEERESRKMAIRKMGDTYKCAAKVLVFDESIRTLCSQDRLPKDWANAFRISMSPWMQRVWTLQEALLAEELHFEFVDGIVPASALRLAMEQEEVFNEFSTITTLVMSLPVWEILADRQQTYSFEKIVSLLVHRMTSRPSDEPLAIAGLLDVDTKKLDVDGRTDLQSRLQVLFSEVKTFTAEILWVPRPPRMEQSPGFRWAPTSLTLVGYLIELGGIMNALNPNIVYGGVVCSSQGLTTEHILPVLHFADVAMDMMEESSHNTDGDRRIILSCPPHGTLYNMDNIPHRHATVRKFNGLVFSHMRLGDAPAGARIPAVAVNMLDVKGLEAPALSEEEGSVELREDLAPIECEFVGHVDLTRWPSLPNPSVAKPLLCKLAEARFTFR